MVVAHHPSWADGLLRLRNAFHFGKPNEEAAVPSSSSWRRSWSLRVGNNLPLKKSSSAAAMVVTADDDENSKSEEIVLFGVGKWN